MISNSQGAPRIYKTRRAFEKHFPKHLVGIEGIELVEYREIVYCRDCKHFDWSSMQCENDAVSTDHEGGASYSLNFDCDDFCSYGERREDEEEIPNGEA